MVRITRHRSLVLDTLAQLADIASQRIKRWLAGPPVVAVPADQPRARVTEVCIAGTWRSIVAEPIRYAKKGTKYVQSEDGDLVAKVKGKQYRYVSAA